MKNFSLKTLKQLFKFNTKSVLYNRYVLYVIALLSLINILYLAINNDFNSVIVFITIGFLTSFFSKNMIIVLSIALLFTHALNYAKHMYNIEGMSDNKNKNENDDDNNNNNDDNNDETENDDNNKLEESDKLEDIEKDIKNSEYDNQKLKDKQAAYDKLKDDFNEFQDIQSHILGNMKEIEPLLNKAESFIEKFESYKTSGKY